MMKITIKYLCIALSIIFTLTACESSSDKNKSESHADLPAKLETVSLNIEGMTCEIGCAKTIESKISKVEGVTESKVDFEAKKGIFTYDANKTSEEDIVNTINGLLNGKTYKASKGKTHCATEEMKSCTEVCAKKCGHEVGEKCEKNSVKKDSCCATDKSKICSEKKDVECTSEAKESCESSSEKSCCKDKK